MSAQTDNIATFKVPDGYKLVPIKQPKPSGRKPKLEKLDPSELTSAQRWKLNYRLKNKEKIKAYQDQYNKKYYEDKRRKQPATADDAIDLNELD